ncbi:MULTISPECIES: aldolase/citrate lyase family protein [unclassified Pseudonocardia]|uniref:HpcH/HpaI aldolase family protein n=1 Tax=unclassified Pseudonocardia TaxID=2619320 RepID=UPI0001FFE328|nr:MULTISPECIES: aldolase/citrate lyase family protein [unclassified Pseudonocardia]ALE72757.1 aldolase [Pseudonocardia sp. EC080625-04]ALL76076.1 aldolase [Pseudonocardia sp. EC080610-09]ALL83103.1 aldolase [Pseudonocardia sp. EC080619-01]OLM19723.1 2,4-dihydroxyhept-2-ene-1,7-dioic acid aldolase [Pseudonocardia sp. Ae707_Ps1]
MTNGFAARLRSGEKTIGYWVVLDNPVGTERIARTGYDYVCIDAQHGLVDSRAVLSTITAVDTFGVASMVRVQANDAFWIGQALDTGARGVIVPMVDTVADAESAVAATRYPPVGRRSYGPMRAQLRVGPTPAVADDEVACLVMIETPDGLANVKDIAAVPGVDGLYVGPSDLRLALGGKTSTDPDLDERFEEALTAILAAANAAGIACGIHCPDGATAARRLAQGFSYASVACDVVHLEQAAKAHLDAARNGGGAA